MDQYIVLDTADVAPIHQVPTLAAHFSTVVMFQDFAISFLPFQK